MAVFVLDTQGRALTPCTEKRARLLLARGRARVHRLVPMVIRLTDRAADSCALQPLRLKLDPGSKTLIHRGKQISEALTARRQMRRKRVHSFGTGDMVRPEVPSGVKAGIHIGRVAVRASGSFNIQSYQDGQSIVVQGISHKHCRVIQRADGYGYFFNRANNTGREQARPKARNAARSALYLPGINAEVSRAN